jgi:alanine racemase
LITATARAGGVLSINLKALQQNYLTLKKRVSPALCGASVKADAYGMGVEPAAKALWAAGCRVFFVAMPEEGRRVRGILPAAQIYVLDGLFSGEAAFYGEHSLRPALSQVAEVHEWAEWCKRQGKKLPAAIHVESGINRLGLGEAQLHELAKTPEVFSHFELSLVLSHLAKADELDDAFNPRQLERFQSLRRLLPKAPASLANSAGGFLAESFHLDVVRPGIALYGGNPFSRGPNPFRPVAVLEGRVLQIKPIEPGESVGYGCSWMARRPTRIAVIAVGYADGYPRACSASSPGDQVSVWWNGHFAPVVGRVSMDMITVDVTDVQGDFGRGAMVELIGAHVTVDDVARWAGTISYEILTRLGWRCARLYSEFDS